MSDWVLRWVRAALLILFCFVGAILAVNTFCHVDFNGGGLSFSTQITLPRRGETRLSLPPLGMASARTHQAPLRIQLELRGVKPSLLQEIGADPTARNKVLADATVRARRAMLKTSVLAIILAGLGSLSAVVLARRHTPAFMAGAFVLGGIMCGGLLGWTYAGYNVNALKQPRYEGMLESAPWVMSILTNSLDGLSQLGRGFEVMARNLPRLTRQAEAGTPMSDVGADLRVLHVSDIHNNKAALKLITALVQSFSVDIVIDTGDLTDLGTPFEAELARSIGQLKVPYVFVPGNHDSPEVLAWLKRFKNVHVLDDRLLTVSGLQILGTPDPAAASQSAEVAAGIALHRSGQELAARWRKLAPKPEIVTAHNRIVLEPLIGLAAVVLHGHDHRASLRRIKGTVVEDAGTAGAAGLRGLASQQDIPYTVDLQYWRKNAGDRLALVAVDAIALGGLNGSLHIVRTSFLAEEGTTTITERMQPHGIRPETQ